MTVAVVDSGVDARTVAWAVIAASFGLLTGLATAARPRPAARRRRTWTL